MEGLHQALNEASRISDVENEEDKGQTDEVSFICLMMPSYQR